MICLEDLTMNLSVILENGFQENTYVAARLWNRKTIFPNSYDFLPRQNTSGKRWKY